MAAPGGILVRPRSTSRCAASLDELLLARRADRQEHLRRSRRLCRDHGGRDAAEDRRRAAGELGDAPAAAAAAEPPERRVRKGKALPPRSRAADRLRDRRRGLLRRRARPQQLSRPDHDPHGPRRRSSGYHGDRIDSTPWAPTRTGGRGQCEGHRGRADRHLRLSRPLPADLPEARPRPRHREQIGGTGPVPGAAPVPARSPSPRRGPCRLRRLRRRKSASTASA